MTSPSGRIERIASVRNAASGFAVSRASARSVVDVGPSPMILSDALEAPPQRAW